MGHEISEIEVNGRRLAEALYANKPAWHGLGTVFDPGGSRAPSSNEIIDILRWRVGLEPLQLRNGSKPVPGFFATVRQDTGTVLGVVGDRYKVVQNSEAFDFLDSLQQDGVVRYEAAMALRGGRTVVLLARMPSVDQVLPGDDLLRYVLFKTSHDGTAAIDAMPTSVRVVCANTLRLALEEEGNLSYRIRHTENVKGKLEKARRYLSQFDQQFTLFRDKAGLLASKRYSKEQAEAYIQSLFPAPEDEATDRVKANYAAKIQKIRQQFKSPTNNIKGMEGTWWKLFNSVTEAIDHGGVYTYRAKTEEAKRENKFLNLMEGDGAALKVKALTLAVDMAA